MSWTIPTAPSFGGHGDDQSRALGGASGGYYAGGHDQGHGAYGQGTGGYGDHSGGHDQFGQEKQKDKSNDKKNLVCIIWR